MNVVEYHKNLSTFKISKPSTMNIKKYLTAHRDYCRAELNDNIMPFWMEHGFDRENGGVYTCLDRDGTLMDSTKSVWFQGRFGFTTAFAVNNVLGTCPHDTARREAWLEASKSCLDFIDAHCFDTDGHMFFTVTADGQPVQKRRYVFSECFAIIAMAEYSLATGDKSWAQRAFDIFNNTRKMLATPGFLPPKTTAKGYSHSITMMFFNVVVVLKKVLDAPELMEQVNESLRIIETYLLKDEYKTILESVKEDGSLDDTIAGRVINPGHCIETSWFLMDAAPMFDDPAHVRELALKILVDVLERTAVDIACHSERKHVLALSDGLDIHAAVLETLFSERCDGSHDDGPVLDMKFLERIVSSKAGL